MCHPAVYIGLAVASTMQQQQAANEMANAQNRAFRQNERLQKEALEADYVTADIQQRQLGQKKYETAEQAADAKLQALIKNREKQASLLVGTLGSGVSGASGKRQLAYLERQYTDALIDIDNRASAEMAQLKGSQRDIQRRKEQRRLEAISSIYGVQRGTYASQGTQALELGLAGAEGYTRYKKK